MTSVLVVDDSQFMRTVIGNILADNGYEVESASDGKAAVKAVEEHQPDIVTMDVQMPGMAVDDRSGNVDVSVANSRHIQLKSHRGNNEPNRISEVWPKLALPVESRT